MNQLKVISRCLMATAVSLAIAGPAAAETEGLAITKGGKPATVIVAGRNPSAPEKRAAQELQHYLQKISGAQIPIAEDNKGAGEPHILLGTPTAHPLIADVLKDQATRLAGLGDEGFLLMSVGNNVVITGNSGDAVLHGVYGLLEKHLGCRWYAKGETGEVIPKQNSIVLRNVDHTEKPAMRFRNIHMCGPGHYDEAFADWMSRNKMNNKTTQTSNVDDIIGALKPRAIKPDTEAHNFSWYVPPAKYYAEHPEYYALMYGKRFDPRSGMGVQLCLSNPDVARIVIEKAKEFLAAHPYVEVMGVTPDDGGGRCECDNCMAMGKSHTDWLTVFVNKVAEEIGKTYPDKLVGLFAYAECHKPPSIKPRPNVRVSLYVNRCWTHALNDPQCKLNANAKKILNGWLAKVRPERLVWGDMSDDPEFLPRPKGRAIANDLQWMAQQGINGYIGATIPEWWENMKLYYYALARATWNPKVNYDAILDEFCTEYYGPAGAEMKKYFLALEERARKFPDCERWGIATQYDSDLLPEAVLAALGSHLTKAETLVAGHKEVEQRVAAERNLYQRCARHMEAIAKKEEFERTVEKGAAVNLIANPGFEEGLSNKGFPMEKIDRDPLDALIEDGLTNQWIQDTHEGNGSFGIERTGAYEGKNAFKMTGADNKSYLRVLQAVKVKKGRKYYFSVQVKADEGVSGPIWLHQDAPGQNDKLTGYSSTRGNWQKAVIPDYTAVRDEVLIILESRYPQSQPGRVYFDDVKLLDITELQGAR
ncbi:MAG: DUF4838 domain-containing protein [Verrucomicrobia bacterium]|nr:DUF4838 domain-containing protein [Verrucomicrobiota bacterium]